MAEVILLHFSMHQNPDENNEEEDVLLVSDWEEMDNDAVRREEDWELPTISGEETHLTSCTDPDTKTNGVVGSSIEPCMDDEEEEDVLLVGDYIPEQEEADFDVGGELDMGHSGTLKTGGDERKSDIQPASEV